jgi:hypothetical protein
LLLVLSKEVADSGNQNAASRILCDTKFGQLVSLNLGHNTPPQYWGSFGWGVLGFELGIVIKTNFAKV